MMAASTIDDLSVRDVMPGAIVACARETAAAEVARLMAARSVHCVAVLGPTRDGSGASRVWGIVSDLDVLSALTRPGPPATAGDLAGEPVITVPSTLPLRQAAELMVRHRAHHIVVADPERHTPVGVVSTLDVARVLAGP